MWFFIYTFILVPLVIGKVLDSSKMDKSEGGRGTLICMAGLIYCMGASISIHWRAESAIHEIYGALYSLMAVIFLCSGMLYFKISEIAKNFVSENKDVINIDELYPRAVKIVVKDKKASVTHLQRTLRIGYYCAADIIDRMEKEGVISKPNLAGKRKILKGLEK